MSDETPDSDPKPPAAPPEKPESPDKPGTPDTPATGGSPAAAPREAPHKIESQYVKDFSFESPRAPEVFFNALHTEAKIDVVVDVATKTIGPRLVEVTLIVEAKASTEEGVAYAIELAYAGVVSIGAIPKEAVPPLLLIEVPRLLFPFARHIIAEATRNGGFSTLFLAPYDFLGLFEAKMAQQRKSAGEAGADAGDAREDA